MDEFISLDDIINQSAGSIPDPVLWRYYKCLERREILVHGEICDDFLEMVVLPYIEMDNDGSGKPITIILSTNGGSVYDGFALIDAIEQAKTPTVIKVISIAASMGSYIAMAGKNNPNVTCVCHKFAVGLIHGGYNSLNGSLFQVRDSFNFNESYEEKIREYVLTHSKIDDKMYDAIERKEYWMDSDEMMRLGIVDKII